MRHANASATGIIHRCRLVSRSFIERPSSPVMCLERSGAREVLFCADGPISSYGVPTITGFLRGLRVGETFFGVCMCSRHMASAVFKQQRYANEDEDEIIIGIPGEKLASVATVTVVTMVAPATTSFVSLRVERV